jgi:hypothetical protein
MCCDWVLAAFGECRSLEVGRLEVRDVNIEYPTPKAQFFMWRQVTNSHLHHSKLYPPVISTARVGVVAFDGL